MLSINVSDTFPEGHYNKDNDNYKIGKSATMLGHTAAY